LRKQVLKVEKTSIKSLKKSEVPNHFL